ncbi:somatostatin receptor type 5-like [Acropora millepora]|uniref:somatostatin receptor type 5-like n=1 Tax=Acropora millepora TaxID=45264 RepID=UPI001CF12062|nr:somatostatin receptor type 5-like [Acropora millepora]
MDFNVWNSFWATCYGVMAFLIIVGNSLTIATLLRKKFRKRPQFLLISLAVADLLVGCATTLFVAAVTVEFRLFALWFVLNLLDIFAGLSSIFHLAVISLERLHATLRPFRHRLLSLKAYWVAIATIWFLSFTMGILVSILKIRVDLIMQRKMLIMVIICILNPLLITCLCYLVIWRNRRKSTVRNFRQNQEARFSGTIFLVTVIPFIMWMPYLYYNIAIRVSSIHTPLAAQFVFKLLQYSNSFVNFVIYILRLPSYRKALFSLCRF